MMTASFDAVTGRYLNIQLHGKPHRIYIETAGQGIPLLCLHTAGADTRQYRALQNDKQVTDRFQIIAFDLPWHGKSSPPPGWQDERYQLTSSQYIDTILTVMNALALDRPYVMGCSIGGRIVLHLALHHPEKFSGLIGLQSGAHVDPYYDLDWLHRSDAHGGEVCAGIVSGLVGPCSPDRERWETLWHYMQSGPGVFKGDLHFYTVDGDIRDQVSQIDTSQCPLWLLSGSYDYSCTPADTALLGNTIAGVKWRIMDGLGHFPMSEDPATFASYLYPVLDDIYAGHQNTNG